MLGNDDNTSLPLLAFSTKITLVNKEKEAKRKSLTIIITVFLCLANLKEMTKDKVMRLSISKNQNSGGPPETF